MKNVEAERAIGQYSASANAVKQLRYDIATAKSNLSRLRERREVIEAEFVVSGLPGSNDTARKAALTAVCAKDPAWMSVNTEIHKEEERIYRAEADVAYHETVGRACRLTAEQITAETLPV